MMLLRVSMYRFVSLALGALVIVSLGYSTFGGLGEGLFTPAAQIVTLGVLLAVVCSTSWMAGRLVKVPAHLESSVITALLLYFMFIPQSSGSALLWIAVAGLAAGLSKYVLVWRARHVFNPAAAGAFVAYLMQRAGGVEVYFGASWWVASADMLPAVTIAAALVLLRTRRVAVALAFMAVTATGLTWALQSFGQGFGDAFVTVFETSAIVFLAAFMLTEPLTLPARHWQQYLVAVVMALVMIYPSVAYVLSDSPPLLGIGDQWQVAALLMGNALALALNPRAGIWLTFRRSRSRGGDVAELVFEPSRPIAFTAGQYAELHVPHPARDRRGTRRVFSIASAPGASTVDFGVRLPEPGSSLKRSLASLTPGDRLRVTDVSGDFVLPRDPSVPVLLIAGGIGVTPFLSQLRELPHRNAVLVYGLSSGDAVPFADELRDSEVVLVCPVRPTKVPAEWTWIEGDQVTAEVVSSAVPDLAQRVAYVSGPPAMVNSVRSELRGRVKSLRTDYFSGY